MIVRTPQAKQTRAAEAEAEAADRPLVIFEEPSPLAEPDSDSQPLLCTYQCCQMVKSDVLDALSKAEKQVAEYRSKTEALSSDFSQAGPVSLCYDFAP